MLHELLGTLHGYPGDVFIEEDGTIKVTNFTSFVHPAEEELLNRICILAWKYKRIQDFVQAHKFSLEKESIIYGLYANALSRGIDEVLETYKADLWELELEVIADPCVSITHFLQLEKYLPLFQHLIDVIELIEEKKPHGCRLLDVVYEYCNCGVEMVETCMQNILKKCHVVFFKQISNWMILGTLSDPYAEFFIAPELPEGEIDDPGGFPKSCHYSKDKNKFILKPNLIPSYIPGHIAEKILFVGQSAGIMDPDMFERPLHKLIHTPSEFGSKEKEYRNMLMKMSENEKFSPSEFISAVCLIRAQCAEQVWKVVVEDANLLAHLHTIKDYYLLGRGELFLAFIDSAKKILNMPATSNTARDANNAFINAAKSTSGRDDTVKHFYLSTQHKQGPQDIDRTNIASASLETGLSVIAMHYDPPFPLHIMFSDKLLGKYNKVFKFLLSVRRVQVELHHCWAYQMKHKDAGRDSAFVSFWQLRSHMAFLLDNLQYYLQVDVLESHFADLIHKVSTVKDFEAIQGAHEQFLSTIISQCFLCTKHVYLSLVEILDVCTSFCSLFKKVDMLGSVSSNDIQHLDTTRMNFQRQTLLLFRVLSGARAHQSSPYLAQLLLRIDYNKYLSSSGGRLGGPEMENV